MPLPTYPPDTNAVRRAKYQLDTTSDAPTAPGTPDDQVIGLDSVRALRIGLQAPAGQTLTGTGTLRAYYLDSVAGTACWAPNPDLDMPVPSAAAGQPVYWLPDVAVLIPAGRFHVRTDGVGVSGPGKVTIHIIGGTIS